MRRSHTIALQIEAPYDAVYGYLSDPRSHADWAAVDPASYRPVGNGDWQGEMRWGELRHVRFTPPNPFGVLDHAIFKPGEEPLFMPMRVTPHDGGTELTCTFLQRPDMDEESFTSTIHWIEVDLLTLKTLLEAKFGPLNR